MDYGFNVPTGGPLANPDDILEIVRLGEKLGFSYVLVPDHIVIPRQIGSRYPYASSGEFPGNPGGACLDQLTYLAFVAAATTRLRLLTSVMVVPHRSPVMTAKMLASLDVLSKGRLTIGCGVGWMREEFEAIGAPPFEQRGTVTDEYIEVFRDLWTSETPVHNGPFAKYDGISFAPKPVQKPHPPIWIGGESGPAIRRAARLGDGWYPIGSNPKHPLNTADKFAAGLEKLRAAAEAVDRDPKTIDLAFWGTWYDEAKGKVRTDGERHLLTGSAADVVADVQALGDLGVRHLFVNLMGETKDAMTARMERFAGEVMTAAGGT